MPTFISTSGHGYLKVTLNQLLKAMENGMKPTGYSMVSRAGNYALLEEDVDAGRYLDAMDIPLEEYRAYRTQYQEGINDQKYKQIPQSIEALEEWIETVSARKDLPPGTIVEIDDYPSKTWEVLSRHKYRRRVEYQLRSVGGVRVGYADANRITKIY